MDYLYEALSGVCGDDEQFAYYFDIDLNKNVYKLYWLPEPVLVDITSNAILYCKFVSNSIIPGIKKDIYIGNHFEFFKRKKEVVILNTW